MTIGHVAVNFVPIVVTFDDDYVDLICNDVNLRLERSFLSSSLFGDFSYDEGEE